MTRTRLLLGILVLAALTLLSGIIHGRMSHRWGPTPDMQAAAEKLNRLPVEFGKWEQVPSGGMSEEMSEDVVNVLQCAGYVIRTYRNQETDDTVRVAIVVGPAHPMWLHRPEICYAGRDYTLVDEHSTTVPDANEPNSGNATDEFWVDTLRSNSPDGGMLRVYFGWNAGGHWSLMNESRFAIGRHPYLYKIQVAADVPLGLDVEGSDLCREFLKDFIPEARQCLIAPGDQGPPAKGRKVQDPGEGDAGQSRSRDESKANDAQPAGKDTSER